MPDRARQEGFGARGRCDVCSADASPTTLWYFERQTGGRWMRTGERTERCSDHPADRKWVAVGNETDTLTVLPGFSMPIGIEHRTLSGERIEGLPFVMTVPDGEHFRGALTYDIVTGPPKTKRKRKNAK